MRRIWIGLICIVFPLALWAQQRAEYNRKGDEAMQRQDYSDAKMWYEEGVADCDAYSIKQLTTIWLEQKQMRPSMRSLMTKCLNCLSVRATEEDLEAIDLLIVYYTEGIGTQKSEELASYWQTYQQNLLAPPPPPEPHRVDTIAISTPRQRMEFFVGYAFSTEAPYGLTFGGVGTYIGWYVRFKTNMSFQDYSDRCNDKGEIINFSGANNESYTLTTGQKAQKNTFAGTAGLVVKCTPWLYLSAGVGYGERALLYSFTTHNYEQYEQSRELWCKNMDSSYTGVAAEADAMVKLGDHFFLSAGGSTINFKYIDLNAGIGVFF